MARADVNGAEASAVVDLVAELVSPKAAVVVASAGLPRIAEAVVEAVMGTLALVPEVTEAVAGDVEDGRRGRGGQFPVDGGVVDHQGGGDGDVDRVSHGGRCGEPEGRRRGGAARGGACGCRGRAWT
jgi:hypothetical protein